MRARPCHLVIVATLLGAACAPKASDDGAPEGGASPTAVDSTLPTVTSSSKALYKADSIIGRDSAFGPKFRIDGQGKLTPIKKP
jgi:hypothetical protein